MQETFEQGWAALPFKEQFPELTEAAAKNMDDCNAAITNLLMNDLLTVSQVEAIRQKRFPKLVAKEVRKARKGNK